MPRPPHRTPKFRLHRPSGQAVVTIDGRDFYLGKYDSPAARAEYDRLIAEWLTNCRRLGTASDGGPPPPTIDELILAFYRFAEGYYVKNGRPTGEATTIKGALRPLRRLYGPTEARAFGPLALKATRRALIEAGLCRNEVNRRTRIVVRMFRWAVENEMVPPAVHQGLKAVSGLRKGRSEARESEPVRPVPDAAVDAIRPHVAPQIWAMVELQRLTGMRPGEAVLLRAGDLDRSGQVWAYSPMSHKTEHRDRPRTVYLGPKAQEVLLPWLKADPDAFLFSPAEALEAHYAAKRAARKSPMTPSQKARSRVRRRRRPPGEHYTPDSYQQAIRSGCTKAGVPPWGPNRLRHNAATRLRREFGLEVARVILGHSSAEVTEVYAEVDREKAIAVMRQVG